jgi:hypothetical protein
MTRMAGSVLIIGVSLALGLLGCGTRPNFIRRFMVSPEGVTTMAQQEGWGTSKSHPRTGSPGAGPTSVSQPAPMTPKVSCARIPLPGQNLESSPRQARRFDGIPDGNSGGSSGAAWKGAPKWGRRGRESEIGGSCKGNSRALDLESWPTPAGVSPTAMIIRVSGELPDRDGPSRRSRPWPASTRTQAPPMVGRSRQRWMLPLIPITLMAGLARLERTIPAIQSFGLINTFRTCREDYNSRSCLLRTGNFGCYISIDSLANQQFPSHESSSLRCPTPVAPLRVERCTQTGVGHSAHPLTVTWQSRQRKRRTEMDAYRAAPVHVTHRWPAVLSEGELWASTMISRE